MTETYESLTQKIRNLAADVHKTRRYVETPAKLAALSELRLDYIEGTFSPEKDSRLYHLLDQTHRLIIDQMDILYTRNKNRELTWLIQRMTRHDELIKKHEKALCPHEDLKAVE